MLGRKKRKMIRLLFLILLLTGCTAHKQSVGQQKPEENQKHEAKVTLTICIAEAQWSDTVAELTKMYVKGHPKIEDIQWILVRKNAYWDLMNMRLATGSLPDIMEVGVGEELMEWYPHLIPLDDLPVMSQIFPELQKEGIVENHCYTIPQAIYGVGILYNMKLLNEAGWNRLPQTKVELKQLCRDLEQVGIHAFMNPYHEITTWVECGLLQMISMKNNPQLYIRQMKKANQKPLSQDDDWKDLLEFCDLTLEYGNRRPLQLDTDLARNYFYIGRYAMILNESPRNLPGMREAGQGVEQVAQIGPLLLSDEADKNLLLMDTVRLGVTKQSQHPKEAQEFLNWLVSDDEALTYQKERMGSMPVIPAACEEGLSSMAQEVYEYFRTGKMTKDMMGDLPMGMEKSTGEAWAQYITGEISKEELMNVYEEYWERYTKE